MTGTSFLPHAEAMLAEREIKRDWVLATVSTPEHSEPDPTPGRTRRFRRIPEHGNRWLRVVYETDGTDIVIVTAFFDRKAGRWT